MKLPHLVLTALLLGCAPQTESESESELDTGPPPLPTETERRVLHEMFTGSTCGPCLEADALLTAVLDANPEAHTLISYQIGSDPYVSHEGIARRMGYLPADKSTYSIPYLHVDGATGLHPVEHNDDAGYQQADFDAHQVVLEKDQRR